MAIPALQRTYQFAANQVFQTSGDYLTDRRAVMFAIKQSLIGFALSPWTVAGSFDGTTGGMDGVDRWLDESNLVWHGSNGSWIVLEQPGLGLQMLIALDLGNADFARVHISLSSAFTWDGLTDYPSAPDAFAINTGEWFVGFFLDPFEASIHVIQSTDGKSTRIIGSSINHVGLGLFAIIEEVVDPVSGWANPVVCGWDRHYPLYEDFNTPAQLWGRHGTVNMQMIMTALCFNNGRVGETLKYRNAISGEFPLMEIGLASLTTGARGRHGKLADIWFGSTGVLNTVDLYPQKNAIKLAQFGDIVVPWISDSIPEI